MLVTAVVAVLTPARFKAGCADSDIAPMTVRASRTSQAHTRIVTGAEEIGAQPSDAVPIGGSKSTRTDEPRGGGVSLERRQLALRMEEHELDVWTQCASAASGLFGNPLGVAVERRAALTFVALRAADRSTLNRVLALGVRAPAQLDDVDAMCSFYRAHGQQNFRVEVTPLARPAIQLGEWLVEKGLHRETTETFKVWRPIASPPPIPDNIDVRRLDQSHTNAIMALNLAAWGAWDRPVVAAWFGATVGRNSIHHYGVFDGNRLVATGALFVGDGLGWVGFDATHPRYRGRGLRKAISSARMADAADQGCQVIHAESAVKPTHRAIEDRWQILYTKIHYASASADQWADSPGEAVDHPVASPTPAPNLSRRNAS